MAAIPSELLAQIANPQGPQNVLEMFSRGSQQGQQNQQMAWQGQSRNALIAAAEAANRQDWPTATAEAAKTGDPQVMSGYISMADAHKRDAEMNKMLSAPPMAVANGTEPQAQGQFSQATLAKARKALQIGGRPAAEKVLMESLGGDQPTDDIREYNMAVSQGFKGTFADYQMMLRRSGRNLDTGAIPPGMQLKETPEGGYYYEPIPGSPEALKRTQAQEAEQQELTASGVVVQDIDRALDTIEEFPGRTTGPGGSILKRVPGTRAHNVSALIDTVKANAGFDRLQRMRESSPTGGALGQVSEREIAYLQATIGNLSLSQDDQQLADNLKRVKNAYLDIIHGPGQGPPREELGFQQQEGGPQPGTIEDGYRFKGGNPGDPNSWERAQ